MMTLEGLWNVSLNAKWAPIVIEGKRIKDKFLRYELLCRVDALTSAWGDYASSRSGLRAAIKEVAEIPNVGITAKMSQYMMKEIGGVATDDRLFEAASDICVREKILWEKWFGRSSCDGDGSVFETNLNQGRCWFNPRTGSIKPTTKSIGKWVDNVGELKEELEWFAKSFPELDVYVTIADDSDTSDWRKKEFIATVRLNGGEIKIVPTRKYNLDKLPTMSGNKARVAWNKFTFKFVRFFHNIQNTFDSNSSCFWHNYRLLNGDYSDGLFYSDDEMIRIVNFYKDVCQEREGAFWRYLNEGMRDVDHFSIDSFIDLASDGSVSPDCGKGWFVYENSLKIDIDFKKLYNKSYEICERYNVDCICDLSGQDEKTTKEEWKTFILSEYHNFKEIEWEWS